MALKDNLIYYYKLDETSGTTTYDSTGTANAAMVTNYLPTINQAGRIGTSYLFNGVERVSIASPYVLTSGNFSISAWIKPSFDTMYITSTYNMEILSRGMASPYNCFRISNGNGGGGIYSLACRFANSWTDGAGAIIWDFDRNYQNEWIHFVAAIDFVNQKSRIYLNGELKKENSDTTASQNLEWRNIGWYNTAAGNSAYGNIDEIAVFNKALSNSDVKRLYEHGSDLIKGTNDYQIFNSCIGYWDLKKNANDVTGALNGSVSGATLTTNRLGEVNSAYSFDATNDYISVTDTGNKFVFNSNTEFSISFWMYRTTSGASQILVNKKTSNQGHSVYNIYSYSDDKILFQIVYESGSNENFYSATTLSNNTWYHIVCTAKYNDTRKIYINGVEDASVSFGTFDIGGGTLQANPVVFGVAADLNALWYGGKLSDVMIFNKKLSSDEVKSLYNLSKNKVVYPLVKGWRD